MCWNYEALTVTFEDDTIRNILCITLSSSLKADKLQWARATNGELTSNEVYLFDKRRRLPRSSNFEPHQWKLLWRTKIHERLKLLFMETNLECPPNWQCIGAMTENWSLNTSPLSYQTRSLIAYPFSLSLLSYCLGQPSLAIASRSSREPICGVLGKNAFWNWQSTEHSWWHASTIPSTKEEK